MKQGRLQIFGALVLTVVVLTLESNPAAAQAKLVSGKLAGVVRDASGTPQMGASVEIVPEINGILKAREFLTNTQGVFNGDRLPPGLYTLRITLAGFLPTLEKHIRVNPNLTTVVRVELESMFASLDQLRRQPPNVNVDADDWKWVLRSASSMRPVLEWTDDGTAVAAGGGSSSSIESSGIETSAYPVPRMRLEFTEGAGQAALLSNAASAPATAFAYDQKLSSAGHVIFAGRMSYDDEFSSGDIATVWLPAGTLGSGPQTVLVMREARFGPDAPVFRSVRVEQKGSVALGDRAVLHYGAEYVSAGLRRDASSLRPSSELDVRVSEGWKAEMIFASLPDRAGPGPLSSPSFEENENGDDLTVAMNELDAFPALMWSNHHPVLESGWHEEIAAEHQVGESGKLQIAAFHDDNQHVAVYGPGMPPADDFQDGLSNAFTYDGGSSSFWGARVAMREKLTEDVEFVALYSFAGALVPIRDSSGLNSLRNDLQTAPRQAIGAKIYAKIPHTRTQIDAGYKWVNGVTVSRVDLFGESLFQSDPYLHIGIKQPLPRFSHGRWEAIADCDNLLAQGYVPLNTRDGHVTVVPAFRTFRGGLSVQF